MVSKI